MQVRVLSCAPSSELFMKEEVGIEWKPLDVDQTIEKLKVNGFQYASAGDVRRLVGEIDRLRDEITKISPGQKLAPELYPDVRHSSHVTRFSDSSLYDEVCVNCGATDHSLGGWGRLRFPCPNSPHSSTGTEHLTSNQEVAGSSPAEEAKSGKGTTRREPTLSETVVKANAYQYASAGDVKRLIEALEAKRRVLIPAFDHGFRIATVTDEIVTHNVEVGEYSEYFGKDHMDEGDVAVTMPVAR